jgi:hypothetical protein
MAGDSKFFDILKFRLRIDSEQQDEVIRELYSHIEDKSQELQESGYTEDEANRAALQILGSPDLIAKQIYEVYSQGSWRQALFSSLPHFLVALLFLMHWWHHTICILSILLAVAITVIYGWIRGKPYWLFPWLGYLLTPVIAAAIILIYLPYGWTLFAAIAYMPIAIFIVIFIGRQVIKKDWLFLSLTLLPFPIVLGWLVALLLGDRQFQYDRIIELAPWIALSFAILALTVVTFIRVRQRWIKAGALLIPEILVLTMITIASESTINLLGWLLLTVLALFLLLLGPMIIDNWLREKETKELGLKNLYHQRFN